MKLTLFAYILFASLMAKGQGVIYDGKKVDIRKLSPKLSNLLYQVKLEAYEEQLELLGDALLEAHILAEAKSTKKSADDLRAKLLAVPKPTEAEAKSFYDDNKSRIRGLYKNVKGDILVYLETERLQERKKVIIDQLLASQKHRIDLIKPEAPRFLINTKDFFKKGKDKARVQVVEFADYRCPHCRTAAATVDELYKTFGDKVEFIFIDFPVLQGLSKLVARGAFCAGQQGKYWLFHEMAFKMQSELSPKKIEDIANQLSLNLKKFKTCSEGSESKRFVESGIEEAQRLGLNGTPSFFVNGFQVHSPTLSELSKAIQAQLGAEI